MTPGNGGTQQGSNFVDPTIHNGNLYMGGIGGGSGSPTNGGQSGNLFRPNTGGGNVPVYKDATGGTQQGYAASGSGQMNQSTYNPNQPYSPAQMQQMQSGSSASSQFYQQPQQAAGGQQVSSQPQANQQQQLFTPNGQQGAGAVGPNGQIYGANGNVTGWQTDQGQAMQNAGINPATYYGTGQGQQSAGMYQHPAGTTGQFTPFTGLPAGKADQNSVNERMRQNNDQPETLKNMGNLFRMNPNLQGDRTDINYSRWYYQSPLFQPGGGTPEQMQSWLNSHPYQKGAGDSMMKDAGKFTGNARDQFTQKAPGTAGAVAQKPQTPAANPYTRGAEGKGNVGFASNPEGESGGMSTQGPQDMPSQKPETAAANPYTRGQEGNVQQQQRVPRPSSDDYQVAAGTGFSTPEQIQGAKSRIAAWEAQNQGQQNPNQGIYEQQVQQGQTGYTPWQQGGNFYGLNVGWNDVDSTTKIAGPTGASGEYVQPAPQGNFPGQPYPGAAGTIVNQDGTGTAWNYGSPQNSDTMNYQAYLSWLQSQGIAGGSGNGGSSSGSSGGSSGGSGSGSSSGVPETGLAIPDLYQKAWEEARKANEDRYNQINAGYAANYQDAMDWQGRSANNLINQFDERYNRNMDTASGLGAQELKDIQDRFTAERGSAESGMIDRGLGNTTIRPSVLGGITRNESDALGGALDRINRLKLQTDMALSGDSLANQQGLHGERLGLMTEMPQRQLDFMERRTDSYPDMDQLLNLALRYGNAEGQTGPGGVMYPPNYNGNGQYQVPNPGQIGNGYPYPNTGGGGGGGGNPGGGSGGGNSRPPGGGIGSSNPYPGGSQQGQPLTPGSGSYIPGYKWDPVQGKYVPDPASGGTGDSGSPMEPPTNATPPTGGTSPTPGTTPPAQSPYPGSPWDYIRNATALPWSAENGTPGPVSGPGNMNTPQPNAAASMTAYAPTDGSPTAAGATGYGPQYSPGAIPNGSAGQAAGAQSPPMQQPPAQQQQPPQQQPTPHPFGFDGSPNSQDWNTPEGQNLAFRVNADWAEKHPGMPPLTPTQTAEYYMTGEVQAYKNKPAVNQGPRKWNAWDPSGTEVIR
jgi:hypothetical protein